MDENNVMLENEVSNEIPTAAENGGSSLGAIVLVAFGAGLVVVANAAIKLVRKVRDKRKEKLEPANTVEFKEALAEKDETVNDPE